jgi:glucose/arabinose dehydrogenase
VEEHVFTKLARSLIAVPLMAVAVVAGGVTAPASAITVTKAPRVSIDQTLTTRLTSPWGLAFLPDGSALVSERDTGLVKRVPARGGKAVTVGRVKGAVPTGEGGLLGLAVPSGRAPRFVFAYVTTATDNRVVRIAWDGSRLGRQRAILTGIPKNSFHDGGRLLVGPDRTLFVSTGDAGDSAQAQDRRSLAGKVLRIRFDGRPAPGNPFRGSPVFTLGHRNVQGLALDSAGRVWASEFGQKDVDELNLLRPGRNYGWPVHEGAANDPPYVDPVVQWSPTSTASPSGIAIVDDVAYVASLRGEVLWQVVLNGTRAGAPRALRLGDLGRLRAVAAAPDGSLWLVTGNTDGRGSPRAGDDRILRLTVTGR